MALTSRAYTSGVTAPLTTLVSLSDSAIKPVELLNDRPLLLGRQSNCDVQITDQSVSRMHAVIESKHGQWYISDRASHIGTFLNGSRLEPNRPASLRHGDVISIGRWSFKVQEGKAVAAEPLMTLIGASRLSDSEGRVETFKSDALINKSEQRLQIVMELAAAVHSSSDEASLAAIVVRAAVAGSAYSRAALIKAIPGTDAVTVLGALIHGKPAPKGFDFSRTLVRAAARGELAKLTSDFVLQRAVSIISQGIQNAICAPLMVGTDVAAFLYLDNADGDAPPQPEVDSYIAAVAKIASMALAQISRAELEQRHKQFAADFTAARSAQEQLMPPASGTIGPISYASMNKPGRLVAGDLLDVVDLGNGRVAICLGDVSGKGIGAAMLMAAAQTQLRATLRTEPDIAVAINSLNREVVTRLLKEGFISLWAGVFDATTRQVSYVDCGHGYWVLRQGDTLTPGPTPDCLPLGIDANEKYISRTITLAPGDRITLMSDGVVEQMSPSGIPFKMDGAVEAMQIAGAPQEDVEFLFRALHNFATSEALADDVTVISFRGE